MARRARVLGCVLSMFVLGCAGQPELRFTNVQVDQAISNWIRCDECSNHQLHHVVILGEPAEAPLRELIDNPQQALTTGMEDELVTRYEKLKAAYPSLLISKSAYVAVHKTAYTNRARARAATALRLIDPGALNERDVVRLRTVPR